MNRKDAYMIVAKAAASYVIKKHPYMTAWITICTAVGIYMGITEMSVSMMAAGILTGLLPSIAKSVGRALLSLDDWERIKFGREKERKRKIFTEYLEEYAKKAVKNE